MPNQTPGVINNDISQNDIEKYIQKCVQKNICKIIDNKSEDNVNRMFLNIQKNLKSRILNKLPSYELHKIIDSCSIDSNDELVKYYIKKIKLIVYLKYSLLKIVETITPEFNIPNKTNNNNVTIINELNTILKKLFVEEEKTVYNKQNQSKKIKILSELPVKNQELDKLITQFNDLLNNGKKSNKQLFSNIISNTKF